MESTVRLAMLADAPAVRAVAAAAWRDTYDGLLAPATIEAVIERAYSLDRLAQRIERHVLLVAEADGEIIAFAEALLDGDHVKLAAIYAVPARRGRGAGSLLLARVRDHFPGLSIAADVLDRNRKGEVFYEARGFVPRETLPTELFGEAVMERRWWLKVD
jgi:GNAT superfamily N-acetyltransferase